MLETETRPPLADLAYAFNFCIYRVCRILRDPQMNVDYIISYCRLCNILVQLALPVIRQYATRET